MRRGVRSRRALQINRKTASGPRLAPGPAENQDRRDLDVYSDLDLTLREDRYVYFVMPACRGQAHCHLLVGGGVLMGRHKKMGAAGAGGTGLEEPPRTEPQPYAQTAPSGVRRLTMTTLSTEENRARFERLRQLSIREPEGPLRAQAVERGALVWAHTPTGTEVTDAKQARIVMRYLHTEAVVYQYVDEERALTRERIDQYLFRDNAFTLRSQRVYRSVLYAAGRVLYPREFPAPRAVLAPRKKGVPAAKPGAAWDLYAIAPTLPEGLRMCLVLVLDLVTGAGLRAQEVRQVTGGDVSTRRIGPGHEIAMIRVRDRGAVDRVIPVIDGMKGQRLLDRARQVGPDRPLMPVTRNGNVNRNSVNRLSEKLLLRGYPGADFGALRNRWILDLAMTPGIPATALLRLAGVGDLRVLADQKALLPDYSPEQLAELLIHAEQANEVAA